VQDEGVGIPEEHLSRIFDPYFTTKERGTQKGTGLGLAICFAVIKNHRGYITVDSQAGRGSTFHIYLPASSREGLPQKERGEEKPLRGRILVMDDEEIDREVIGEMLRRISFSAEFASDGEETVELYRKAGSAGEPFDALIMDLVIPGRMGGKEAINKLLEIDPEVKAIVTSGYSNDPILMDFRSYGFSGVLPKPFNVDELNQVLNRVLFR
jgi:CheY-like chemotaxis protein